MKSDEYKLRGISTFISGRKATHDEYGDRPMRTISIRDGYQGNALQNPTTPVSHENFGAPDSGLRGVGIGV
jgi:hypothetical protein